MLVLPRRHGAPTSSENLRIAFFSFYRAVAPLNAQGEPSGDVNNVESAQTTQMSFSKRWAGLPEAEAATKRASFCSLTLRWKKLSGIVSCPTQCGCQPERQP